MSFPMVLGVGGGSGGGGLPSQSASMMDWAPIAAAAQPRNPLDGPSGFVVAAAAVGSASPPAPLPPPPPPSHRIATQPALGSSGGADHEEVIMVDEDSDNDASSDAQQRQQHLQPSWLERQAPVLNSGQQEGDCAANAAAAAAGPGFHFDPYPSYQRPIPTPVYELDLALNTLAADLSQTPQAEAFCKWLLSQVRSAVQSPSSEALGWSRGTYNVRTIGSHAYALAHPTSALDLEIYKLDPRAPHKTMDEVGQMLSASSHACSTFDQSVTLVRCDALEYLELTTRFSDLKVRLFVNHPTAWKDAYWIDRCLAQRAPYLQTVCIVFAHFCHTRDAFGFDKGGFNMYNIVSLVERLCRQNTMHIDRQGPQQAVSFVFLLLLDYLAHGFRGTHSTLGYGMARFHPQALSPDLTDPTAPQARTAIVNWRNLVTEFMSSVAVIKSRQTGAMRHTKREGDPRLHILKGIIEVDTKIVSSRQSFAQRWTASLRDAQTGLVGNHPLDLDALAAPANRHIPPRPAGVRIIDRRDPLIGGVVDLTNDTPYTPTHPNALSPAQAAQLAVQSGAGAGASFHSADRPSYKIKERPAPSSYWDKDLRPRPPLPMDKPVVNTTNMKARPRRKERKRAAAHTEVVVIDSSSESDDAPAGSNSSPAAPLSPKTVPASLNRPAGMAPIPGELLDLFSSSVSFR
ncbi:hypothetical protein HDU89_001809 [Geranomyces variabilis]|nr:hypothetical protein HDU89_001809 [Geranomyces variabilis]